MSSPTFPSASGRADVTEAVSDALKRPPALALNGKKEPLVRPVPPVGSGAGSSPSAHAAVTPAGIVTTPTAQPVATTHAKLPLLVANTPAATVVQAPIAIAPVVRPVVPTQPVEPVAPAAHCSVTAAIASAPVATAAAPPPPAAGVPVESHIAGTVIIGTDGMVPGTSSPAAPESLADAALRLRREKLHRQQKQVP